MEKIFLKGKPLVIDEVDRENQDLVIDYISCANYQNKVSHEQYNFLRSLGGLPLDCICQWFSPFFDKNDYLSNLIMDEKSYLGIILDQEHLPLNNLTPSMLDKYLYFKLKFYHVVEQINQRVIYLLSDFNSFKGFNINKFDFLRFLEKNKQHIVLPIEYNRIIEHQNAFDLTISETSLVIKIINDSRLSKEEKMTMIENLGLKISFNVTKKALSSTTVQHRLNKQFLLCDFIKSNTQFIC